MVVMSSPRFIPFPVCSPHFLLIGRTKPDLSSDNHPATFCSLRRRWAAAYLSTAAF
jgi:hypothetical protein